jgi:hypothetical protein
MSLKYKILFIFFLSSLFSCSYAGTIDPNISDAKYIEYGKDFKYVGKLCGTYQDETLFCASAVVIREDIILTAAHVVKGYKNCKIKIEDKEFEINKFIWPLDFDQNIYGLNDIAIGFLKQKIQLNFYPELYDKEDELDKVCCIAGYGLSGNFITGAESYDDKRRAGSNIIEEIDKQLLICRPSKPTDKKRTSLEFLTASGDSGGGLFINNKLAGINSCISGRGKKGLKSTYDTESGHTRISIHRKWILQNID